MYHEKYTYVHRNVENVSEFLLGYCVDSCANVQCTSPCIQSSVVNFTHAQFVSYVTQNYET